MLNDQTLKKMYSRNQLIKNLDSIPTQGGVYFWYVSEAGAKRLNIPVEGCTTKNGYYLVYIGLSKDLKMRLKWHTVDSHRVSSVKAGAITVLRQKLSTLLSNNWHSGTVVDDFMDNSMLVEWSANPNYEKVELELIQSNILPLNVRNNKHPFRRELSKRNMQAKRNSLNYFQNN